MAVLGKIRSKGVLLICIIGLGLFSFIAGDLWKSLEQLFNSDRDKAGEVLGKKVSVQDFQDVVNEWTEVYKMMYGSDNIPSEVQTQIQDQAWQDYVTSQVINKECEELGLTVTDEELKNVLNEGDSRILSLVQQFGGQVFFNQQTGKFDANIIRQMFATKEKANQDPQARAQYEQFEKYWLFIENHLRTAMLKQKYETLMQACILSNSVDAKANYTAKTDTYSIDVVAFPFAKEAEPKVSEDELKAKYEEMKNRFRAYNETRVIKYINYVVTPSDEDIATLQAKFEGYKAQLDTLKAEDYLTEFGTDISYLGLPVTKNALAENSAAATQLETLQVGETSEVFEGMRMDSQTRSAVRTKNVMKLLAKESLPDSVQYRGLMVKEESTDSVFNAIKAGGNIDEIAKKYDQAADSVWMTPANYEKAPSAPQYYKDLINTLYTTAVGDAVVLKNYAGQGDLVIKILDKRNDANAEDHSKYTYALLTEDVVFYDATYNNEFNAFSAMVSKSQSIDALKKNAGTKYQVQDYNMNTSMHGVANIPGTIEAQRWLFNEDTKEGQVSTMYACGDNNQFLVVALEKIIPEGYASLDVASVKDIVKAEVIKDKRAKAITDKLKGVNSIEGAVAKGGEQFTTEHITAAAGAITIGNASETGIAGAIAATANGAFSAKPFVGENGVYVFKVTEKTTNQNIAYDEKAEKRNSNYKMVNNISAYLQQLVFNAEVRDNRYKFFQ